MSPAPRKSLGQHFLSDPAILGRIADGLELAPGDVVLEIGPGRGDLTRVLLARGARVVGIEKDRNLARECQSGGAPEEMARATIVVGDALRLDWHALVNPALPAGSSHWKIAGNIPYNITSPLIEQALRPPLPERIVFLVQAEVADRLAATPGTRAYGALTVGVQAQCRVEKLFRVRPGSFRPPPRVESAVVRFTPLRHPLVPPEEVAPFRAFVTALFSLRRKQLRGALRSITGAEVERIEAGLRALGLEATARAETLSPGDLLRLLHWRTTL